MAKKKSPKASHASELNAQALSGLHDITVPAKWKIYFFSCNLKVLYKV